MDVRLLLLFARRMHVHAVPMAAGQPGHHRGSRYLHVG